MTRHEKQQEHWQLRDRIHDAITKLAYWPAEWALHVELTDRVDVQLTRPRRVGKGTLATRQHLYLRVPESWTETVLARDLAVINGEFVLFAHKVEVADTFPDALYFCETAWCFGYGAQRVETNTSYWASYGGIWFKGDSRTDATNAAFSYFHELLTGEIAMPF